MSRNIVFIAPFPADVTMRFVRAAKRLDNVKLLGVVHTPAPNAHEIYDDLVRIENPMDTAELIDAVERLKKRHGQPYRIIGVLEMMQEQLALLRQHFGVEGTPPAVADAFRDKAKMKEALRKAGLPTARHKTLTSAEDARAFVQEVGFPMVIKPPAGLGTKSTFRIRNADDLAGALQALHISPQNPMLAEEFLTGKEFSFETLTTGGVPRWHSISHYTPTCLEAVETPWIQWCCYLPRDISGKEYDGIRDVGFRAIQALGLKDGMTHMEWFMRPDGSLAIGEIAQRPAGANISIMNGYAHEMDIYKAWNRAVIDGGFDGPYERKYAVGTAFLRGVGRGRVTGATGFAEIKRQLGPSIVEAKIPTVGDPKNDSYEGDGYIVVRDPSTDVVKSLLSTIIQTIRIYYA
jgi:formate-dependent phosphoribosylglycinamide formyltransferase (GAR transformylase)